MVTLLIKERSHVLRFRASARTESNHCTNMTNYTIVVVLVFVLDVVIIVVVVVVVAVNVPSENSFDITREWRASLVIEASTYNPIALNHSYSSSERPPPLAFTASFHRENVPGSSRHPSPSFCFSLSFSSPPTFYSYFRSMSKK